MFKKLIFTCFLFFSSFIIIYPSKKENTNLFGYCYSLERILSRNSIEQSKNLSKKVKSFAKDLTLISANRSKLVPLNDKIKISELDRISVIENAVHNRNYPEKDLFQIYKRFQFNINQLLNAEEFYKSLSNIEGRALIYQK